MKHCLLCRSTDLAMFHSDRNRTYLICGRCSLVQVPPEFWLSADDEKAVYDRHDNRVDDPGYRRFLGRTAQCVQRRHTPPARGLDFGCGPVPALARLLAETGFHMQCYDHFYASDPEPLNRTYDFVTATEVVEHLHDPRGSLEALWSILRPGGSLVLQTKRVLNREAFDGWHYTRDPTHVAFFALATFQWLCRRWNARAWVAERDVVVLFRDPADVQE